MSRTRYTLSNPFWELEIQNNNRKGFIYKLNSKVTDKIYDSVNIIVFRLN